MTDDIQFNEPGMSYSRPNMGSRQSFLIGLVMKLGIAKNTKQAQMVLIIVGVLSLIVMFLSWPRDSTTIPANNGIEPIGAAPSNNNSGANVAPVDVEGDDLFNF